MSESCLIKISGRVQGVGFRCYTSRRAVELGIEGYVKNNEDGTVTVFAVSEDNGKMKDFIDLLKKGPPSSSVKQMDIDWNPAAQKDKKIGFYIK